MSMEFSSSACILGLYTLKFRSQNHLVEHVRSFEDISVLDASVYEQFIVHIKRA